MFLFSYRIAFLPDNSDLDEIFLPFDITLDFLYLVDIILNFFVCYYDNEDNLITDSKKIVKKYLKYKSKFKTTN